MDWNQIFGLANSAALAAWSALILLPRWQLVLGAIRIGVIGSLSLLYTVLVAVYFFRIEDGGFGSIAQVRQLFLSDPVLVAGWVHYLAFDLFAGLWIAERADRLGMARLIQAPILLTTFMFQPAGLLLYGSLELGRAVIATPQES